MKINKKGVITMKTTIHTWCYLSELIKALIRDRSGINEPEKCSFAFPENIDYDIEQINRTLSEIHEDINC